MSDAPAGDPPVRDHQVEADAYLAAATDGMAPEEAALALSVFANRAATRLHNLARGQATDRKGTPTWATWAGLQNATRKVVLETSAGRDLAARLAGRRR